MFSEFDKNLSLCGNIFLSRDAMLNDSCLELVTILSTMTTAFMEIQVASRVQ